jgi:phosphatidylserine/phosphatidylglycerophosphate/cardiolipin synthase-like enzyme
VTKRRSSTPPKAGKTSTTTTAGTAIGALIFVLILVLNQCGQQASQPSPTATVAATPTIAPTLSDDQTSAITLPLGWGAQRGFWQVLFTAPSGSRDPASYTGGIDEYVARALGSVTRTLDIAAYEFNSPALTQAMLDAKTRGVRVRVVTDDEGGTGAENTTLGQLQQAGIPVVTDGRRALMHDKFMILDSATVITGSWNFTINDTYRNNNNALILRSQNAVANYQAEFDEMFVDGRFGPTSPRNTPNTTFTQDGIPIEMYLGPEDDPMLAVTAAVRAAQQRVRFMAFSFTYDALEEALLEEAARGLDVQGIFETTGSGTQYSAMAPLLCAGVPVRRDGNPFVLHHKVFIVDDTTVITGSFNFSSNATDSNDENLIIIRDAALAAHYLAEYDRRWAEAVTPPGVTCP